MQDKSGTPLGPDAADFINYLYGSDGKTTILAGQVGVRSLEDLNATPNFELRMGEALRSSLDLYSVL